MTPAWLRPLAEADLVERSRYLAGRFFASSIAALQAIERMPGTGSPRVGELCGIAGLRVRRIEGFPCRWFYFERAEHLDVVRLLADAQDLTAILDAFSNE